MKELNHAKVLLLLLFLLSGVLRAEPPTSVAPPLCAALAELTPNGQAEVRRWWDWVQHADTSPPGSPPERRIKLINLFFREPGQSGVLESADLARPQWLTMPDGRKQPFIFASGTYAFVPTGGDLNRFLRGGAHGRKRVPIEFHFPDGRRMKGPYHPGSLPWDFFVTEWPVEMFDAADPMRIKAEKAGRKTVPIGYGGAMVQPYRLAGAKPGDKKLPRQLEGKQQNNPSRSRHAFEVEISEGKIVARDLGSLFGHLPSVASEWLSETHEHGYGGRPFLNPDGTPYRDAYGKGWMEYERVVTEEVRYEDGRIITQHKENGVLTIRDAAGKTYETLPPEKITKRVPKVTEIFARRLKNPSEVYRKGETLPDGKPADEEVKLMAVGPHGGGKPYPSSSRGGEDGFLVEGGNHNFIDAKDLGSEGGFHVMGASNGNFVDANTADGKGYGVIVGFRPEKAGPIGPYEPLTQLTEGTTDYVNFTSALGHKYGIIWGPARPDFFKDGAGKWWMLAHGVPLHTLRPELRRGGWPPGPKEFEEYARAGYVIPIQWSLKDGKPWLTVEDPPLP